MNAAYLMLTTAWLAGADPAPAAAPAGAVVSTSNGSCSGGCGGCATDCCEKPSLCERIKARFSRSKGCGCETTTCCAPAPTCCKPAPVCCPAPKPVCCPAPKPVCCAPAPSCGCEDSCKKPGLFARIKARFSRHNDCCETSCGCGGCSSGCGATSSAEPIPAQPKSGDAPKKMPTTPMTMNGVISNVTPVATSSPF